MEGHLAMRRSITLPVVALVVLGGLAAPARAGSISGQVSGDTTITPIGSNVFIQNFSGEGDDTLLGSFTMESQSTINFSNPLDIIISNGTCSQTFAEGTLFGTCSGSGTTIGMGTGTFETEIVFTGGTGLFAGATGGMTVTGTIESTGPTTGEITGSYVGTLSSVPEPGGLALLVPALAVGACVQVFERRRKIRSHRPTTSPHPNR
jgi:hypothetical protein